jgi:hypothetical protein
LCVDFGFVIMHYFCQILYIYDVSIATFPELADNNLHAVYQCDNLGILWGGVYSSVL